MNIIYKSARRERLALFCYSGSDLTVPSFCCVFIVRIHVYAWEGQMFWNVSVFPDGAATTPRIVMQVEAKSEATAIATAKSKLNSGLRKEMVFRAEPVHIGMQPK